MNDDEEDNRPQLSEEEIAAMPTHPSEIFDPAGHVDSDGVKGDALLVTVAKK